VAHDVASELDLHRLDAVGTRAVAELAGVIPTPAHDSTIAHQRAREATAKRDLPRIV
jgi:hypothetical protein